MRSYLRFSSCASQSEARLPLHHFLAHASCQFCRVPFQNLLASFNVAQVFLAALFAHTGSFATVNVVVQANLVFPVFNALLCQRLVAGARLVEFAA